jgi:hypothetical protein
MKLIRAYYFVILLLPLLMHFSAGAQQADTAVTGPGIVQDPKVDLLVSKHIQANQAVNRMDGFRIQLFSDSGNNSKTKAQAARDEFQAKFPAMGVYLTFKSPNYKVRIGDFRTKLDAQRFLNEITADYPNAFIITDQINLPKTD